LTRIQTSGSKPFRIPQSIRADSLEAIPREESLKKNLVAFSRYGTTDTTESMIGVMSPPRMEYETTIPAVRYMANHLDQMTMMFYDG